jgi:hypothetical protein
MNVKETFEMLVKDNFISETDDALPYLIIIGALQEGVDRQKVRDWLGTHLKGRVKEYKRMWKLAEDNQIFVDGCISVEDVDEGLTNIELALYGSVLLGYITRHTE